MVRLAILALVATAGIVSAQTPQGGVMQGGSAPAMYPQGGVVPAGYAQTPCGGVMQVQYAQPGMVAGPAPMSTGCCGQTAAYPAPVMAYAAPVAYQPVSACNDCNSGKKHKRGRRG